MPLEATYIPGGKAGGWWQQCRAADPGQAVHCHIWNGNGLVLEDEEFLPYDQGAPPDGRGLKDIP